MTVYNPTYYYHSETSGLAPKRDGRATAQGVWSGTPIFGTWAQQSAYQLAASALTLTAVTGRTASGFVSTAYWSSGAWFLTASGALTEYTSVGVVTSAQASGGTTFIGMATPATGTIGWLVDASGNVFSHTAGTTGFAFVEAFASGQCPPTEPVTVSGGLGAILYAILGATSGLGSMTVGAVTPVSAFVGSPFSFPEVLASSGSGLVAIGGWNSAQIPSGFSSIVFCPTVSALFAATVSAAATSGLQTWLDTGSGVFVQQQAITSGAGLKALAWVPNGTELLASLVTNGMNVYSFAASALSFSGNTPLGANATSAIIVTPDNINGLTVQPAGNTLIQISVSGGTQWISGATLALNSPQCGIVTSPATIVIGWVSGTATYSLASGLWTQSASAVLPCPVSYLALDWQNNVVAAGTSGLSGYVITSGATISFPGSVSGLIVQQQQFFVYDGVNTNIKSYALSVAGSALTLQNSFNVAGSRNTFVFGDTYMFLSSSSTTLLWQLSAPYTITHVTSGMVSLYNGTTFITTNLGTSFRPTALAFDTSANIWCATNNNYLFTIASGGGVTASGVITNQSGQPQATSLGISSLMWFGGHLYATSSLNEAYAQLT